MKELYGHEIPTWLRLLGAWRINRDSIDFKWGYFSPKPGFKLLLHRGFYFDSTYRISFCLGWGVFHIKLPFTTKLEQHCDWPSYGVDVQWPSIWIRTGDCEQNQHTRKMLSWDLPFFTWVFDFHQYQDKQGEWVDGGWENKDLAYSETHPYTYTLRSGEIQSRKATCLIERRQWHRKWFPFLKLVRITLDISFDGEVGERAGSWKGGTVGCGWDILPGETILQALRRMEQARRFR